MDSAARDRVERFLTLEARLMDEHRYKEWLALWADEARRRPTAASVTYLSILGASDPPPPLPRIYRQRIDARRFAVLADREQRVACQRGAEFGDDQRPMRCADEAAQRAAGKPVGRESRGLQGVDRLEIRRLGRANDDVGGCARERSQSRLSPNPKVPPSGGV